MLAEVTLAQQYVVQVFAFSHSPATTCAVRFRGNGNETSKRWWNGSLNFNESGDGFTKEVALPRPRGVYSGLIFGSVEFRCGRSSSPESRFLSPPPLMRKNNTFRCGKSKRLHLSVSYLPKLVSSPFHFNQHLHRAISSDTFASFQTRHSFKFKFLGQSSHVWGRIKFTKFPLFSTNPPHCHQLIHIIFRNAVANPA